MSERKPMVLVFAGPNSSGKSTVTTYFDKVGTYTNADDIVAATGMDNMEAARLVDKMRYRSIEPVRIIRKHKEEISIYPNDLWSEQMILNLL